MGGKLNRKPLGELLSVLIDHRGQTPGKLHGYFSNSGIKVLSAKNIKESRILENSDIRFVGEEMFERWMPVKLELGDVLLTSEAPLGEVAYLNHSANYCLGQRLFALRSNPSILVNRYLYYWLRTPMAQSLLKARATGTTAQGIRQSELLQIQIEYPNIETQRNIAKILGSLDDKIEMNRNMNETLEAMARAIFKSWFVDFDPVHIKSEGRDTGLPKEIEELFPDKFVESEMGRIPKGWKVGTIGDEFNLTMGQSPPGETYNEIGDGVPFYQGRTDFGFRYPTCRMFCTAPTRMANLGDTLISVRAPVGDINMASEKCCIGRGVAAIRHKSESRSYTLYLMQSLVDIFAEFEAGGTVFGCMNKSDFESIKHTVPPRQLIDIFEGLTYPDDQSIENRCLETANLTMIRDSLLPKLMSGKIALKE